MGPDYFKHLLKEMSLSMNDRVPLGMVVSTTCIPKEFIMTITVRPKAKQTHSGWAVKCVLTV